MKQRAFFAVLLYVLLVALIFCPIIIKLAYPMFNEYPDQNAPDGPGFTSFGTAVGIVIMLIAFGPGIYFFFKIRFERKRPKTQETNKAADEQSP